MKSDLNNGYNERDKKNDDLEKNGDVDMPNGRLHRSYRHKIYILLFIAGGLFLLGSSTVVLYIVKGIQNMKELPIPIVAFIVLIFAIGMLIYAIKRY